MANVQKIIKTAAYDSIKKMRSFRFISAVMMVVGLVLAVTSGMDQLIGDVNEKVSIWIVPHIFSNTFLRHFTELLYVICYRIFLILMRMNYITFQEWDEKVVYGENAIHDTIHVYVYNYFVCCMRTCICSQNQLYNGMGKSNTYNGIFNQFVFL